jgi:N-methylhydantoinase A/oxoprolinase/acetone carboxylase beta subunit
VATNAVLERKGARLGLLTTEGFTDILEIGRQNRRQIYDLVLKPETPVFLAPGARRRGVIEAMSPHGEVLAPLDLDSLAASVEDLLGEGVEAIAICFLFSFANPAHEREAAAWIRERHPGLVISLSSEVDRAFREYERTVVTCFDAYVKRSLDDYLVEMEGDLERAGVSAPLQIMQSRGGLASATVARQRPIRLFMSGPAAGVVGALEICRMAGYEDLITVDIGGTSSDIALNAKGQPVIRADGLLDGYRIRVPMVDVNSIGAGGGSVAWIDAGGGLRVGPQSAGAEPGPACYGRGGEQPTVTDASIVLGLLDPAYFAGGSLMLDPTLAYRAIETKIARPLGIDAREAALGIHRVVNVQMAEGVRLVSISRGVDPRGFALMPFGGGGALHATALATEIGIETVVVPRHPGVLCAAGLLSAAIEHEAASAFIQRFAVVEVQDIVDVCARLAADCAALMRSEGVRVQDVETCYYADVCYVGQSYSMEVGLDTDNPGALIATTFERFRARHDQVYGHSTDSPAQFVNLRAVQRVPMAMAEDHGNFMPHGDADKGSRMIVLAGVAEPVAARIYARDGLEAGRVVDGPAIIEQPDTTTLVEPGWRTRIAANGIMIMTRTP